MTEIYIKLSKKNLNNKIVLKIKNSDFINHLITLLATSPYPYLIK